MVQMHYKVKAIFQIETKVSRQTTGHFKIYILKGKVKLKNSSSFAL